MKHALPDDDSPRSSFELRFAALHLLEASIPFVLFRETQHPRRMKSWPSSGLSPIRNGPIESRDIRERATLDVDTEGGETTSRNLFLALSNDLGIGSSREADIIKIAEVRKLHEKLIQELQRRIAGV